MYLTLSGYSSLDQAKSGNLYTPKMVKRIGSLDWETGLADN